MAEQLPFSLQEGEKVLAEVKPQMAGFVLSRIGNSLAGIIILALLFGFLFWSTAITYVTVLLVVLIAWIVIAPFIAYGKYKYWITNMRVIGSRGLIGYSIESIPLENITDVTLTRTLVEQILNLSSLVIVPIGGMAVSYRRGGGANYFTALAPEQALDLQKSIFKLRDERKKVVRSM